MKSNKLMSSRSLKFKLVSLSMSIVIMLGVLSLGILKNMIRLQKSTLYSNFESYARTLSDAIGAQFFEKYGDVQAFSVNPTIQSLNRQSVIDTLNTFSMMYRVYDLILVVDKKGSLVAANSKSPDGKDLNLKGLYEKNYSDTPWFKAVMAGQFTEDKEKGLSGTFVEDVQIDPWVSSVYGSDRLGNSFSAAIKNAKGETIGVITNRAGSRWFEVAFKELFAGLKRMEYKQSNLVLLRKDGVVLYEYSSDPNSSKLEDSKYNWDSLLKFNLASAGYEAGKLVTQGQSGAILSMNIRTKKLEVTGYTPVNSARFVEKIGWSVLVRDDEDEVTAYLHHSENTFYLIFLISLLVAAGVFYWYSSGLSKRLAELASQLSSNSGDVSVAAMEINQSSTVLSEAAIEQASAIQETAASIDEVSSMVKKNADNASQSQKVSQNSRETAERGQSAVQEMIQSIRDISQSNASIMTQVEEGNRQISEIVHVISEIENKTKVINDIVFQTKLLSFNASVEAARAGEHGKGFAVVAEEVGNLAQMSGTAAKEISTMLAASIQKVDHIVNETKSRVERLVVESKTKVEDGTQVAQKCGEALGSILNTVHEVDSMVSEISAATQEQSQGVSEINKAVNQLDQVTQQNTSIAQAASRSALGLTEQASRLKSVVGELYDLINGSGTQVQNEQMSHVPSLKNKTEPSGKLISLDSKRAKNSEYSDKAQKLSSAVPSKNDPRFKDI